jgi:hypothetical protein
MNTKYSTVHHGTEGQKVEHLTAPAPNITASVFSLTFVIEPVYLRYLPRLVVSTNESNAFRISNFKCEEKKKSFNTVETTVDKIA